MVGILIENCINLRQFSVRIFLRSDIHVKWWTRLGTLCLPHAAYNLRQIFSGSIFVHIISSGSCNVWLCHFPIFYDLWQNYFRSCRVRLTVGPFSSLFITFSLFKCCWSNSTRQVCCAPVPRGAPTPALLCFDVLAGDAPDVMSYPLTCSGTKLPLLTNRLYQKKLSAAFPAVEGAQHSSFQLPSTKSILFWNSHVKLTKLPIRDLLSHFWFVFENLKLVENKSNLTISKYTVLQVHQTNLHETTRFSKIEIWIDGQTPYELGGDHLIK